MFLLYICLPYPRQMFRIKFLYRLIIVFILLLQLAPGLLIAQNQKTKIMGKVIDSLTQEPMPFVVVYIQGTTIGVRTDFNGEYAMEFTTDADSLTATFVGYITVQKPIELHKFQTINFALLENEIDLKELVIRPTTNPAEILLKKIVQNKKQNSGEDLKAYEYEAYSKIEFDANNISEKFQDSKMVKPFQFVFENIDTSTINGKSYLPLFLTEALSNVYYRAEPKTKKEIITASRVSGVDNESIAQFLGDMYQDVNIYDNYVTLFDKNFVSPIANFGLGYYKYYLTDSTFFGKNWCYKIMFKPRRKQELTFTGYFWVADTSFAIKKFDMRIADDANINFINDLVTLQEFEPVNDTGWMVTIDKLVVDFNIVNNTKSNMGFYGTKTTSYRNYIFNKPKEDQFYSTPTKITVEDGASAKSDTFWIAHRHDTLSKDEKAVYKMVDTLETVKLFRTYVDVVKTIVLGYYVKGNFEWGPYFNVISFNDMEGARLRIGGRTSNKFSTKLMLDGHLAFGTKDQIFKYGGGFIYMLSKNPRKSVGASYKFDIEQLGESQNSFITDNILASLLRRSPYDKLTTVKEFKCDYENEWFTGFSNTLHFTHRDIFPLGATKFEFTQGGQTEERNSITTSEIQIDTRFAYNEKFVFGEFERTSMGTEYPVLTFKYSYGIKGFLNGDYEYTRTQIGLEHWFNIGSFGWSKYIIEAGRIWGTLPYPLLKLHEGNETWVFDDYAFNMMNYYEFVSDKYISAYYVHHFDGFFLNRIPLMRKLKWREVASVRGAFGNLAEKNIQASTFPASMSKLDKPYFEASIGVENIFKFIKINAVWRLSHLDHLKADGNTVNKFGILGTFQIYF
jgi:hypothetical protein